MNDEIFYETVVEELKLNGPRTGLWAKAFAKARGDENQAKAYYLEWRAGQLKDEFVAYQKEKAQGQRAQKQTAEKKPEDHADEKHNSPTASSERIKRVRPFVVRLRGLGLSIETAVIQAESRGLTNDEATKLVNEVFALAGR